MNDRTLDGVMAPMLREWFARRGYTPAALTVLERNIYTETLRDGDVLTQHDLRTFALLVKITTTTKG